MREAVPCFRCKDEHNSEYVGDDPAECPSCEGRGTIIPGTVFDDDFKLIKRFVHVQWWTRLRVAKALGLKLGKKKARDRLILKQAKELFADFKRMGRREQGMNRTGMQAFITRFENASKPRPAPVDIDGIIDEAKERKD